MKRERSLLCVVSFLVLSCMLSATAFAAYGEGPYGNGYYGYKSPPPPPKSNSPIDGGAISSVRDLRAVDLQAFVPYTKEFSCFFEGTHEITVTANTDIKGAVIDIENLGKTPPEGTSPPDGVAVYSYLEGDTKKINASVLASAEIHVCVQKLWEKGKNVNPNDIAVYLSANNGWTKLKTEHVAENLLYDIYRASTPDFTAFAVGIAQKQSASPSDENADASKDAQAGLGYREKTIEIREVVSIAAIIIAAVLGGLFGASLMGMLAALLWSRKKKSAAPVPIHPVSQLPPAPLQTNPKGERFIAELESPPKPVEPVKPVPAHIDNIKDWVVNKEQREKEREEETRRRILDKILKKRAEQESQE